MSDPLDARIVHCWESGPDTDDDCGQTCMLLLGHEGPHEWTRDDEIGVIFPRQERNTVTDAERKWLETVAVGGELKITGPTGARAFDVGYGDLERAGYVRVTRDAYGIKIVRLK